MTTIHIDLESKSCVDLRKHGLARYSRDITTDILMLGWAVDDQPVQLWEPHLHGPHLPYDLKHALPDPAVRKIAWNAQFERAMLQHVLGLDVPVEQWRCAMVLALMLSLPGSLKDAGKVVGLPEEQQKLKTGSTLIRRFCMPREPTEKKPWKWSSAFNEPEDWALFCEYCKQDVETERRIWKLLSKFYVPESEWALWHYDQEINERGIPVDVEFCKAALEVATTEKKRLTTRMKELTGLANPGSTAQILPWLRARGYPFSEMKKDRVAKAMEDFDNWGQRPPKPEPVAPLKKSGKEILQGREVRTIQTYAPEVLARQKVLEARYESDLRRHETFAPLHEEAKIVLRLHQQASRSSWRKYQSILDTEFEGRLYFNIQFCGAGRTGRWSGRGVQLQNLPRPAKAVEDYLLDLRELILARDNDTIDLLYGDVMTCLASSIRSAIKAAPGSKFTVADLASIESRVVAWLTNCRGLLEVFEKGQDAYKAFGVHFLGKPYEEITKAERNLCKPACLGGSYRLGGGTEVGEYPDTKKTGLWAYSEAMGVKMTKQQAHDSVFVFRSTYPEIVQAWYDLENAAMTAIRTKQPQKCGRVQFDIVAPFLRVMMPSGRGLYYLRPRVEKLKVKLPGGDVMEKWQVTYEGTVPLTKQWGRVQTQGGKWIENLVQALARDVLAYGMLEARKEGFATCLTIHDELICEQPEDDVLDHEKLEQCMSVVPPWARGLPLGADGWDGEVYRK